MLFGSAVLLGLGAFAAQGEQQARFAELLARAQPA
jgi:hypothetical protein